MGTGARVTRLALGGMDPQGTKVPLGSRHPPGTARVVGPQATPVLQDTPATVTPAAPGTTEGRVQLVDPGTSVSLGVRLGTSVVRDTYLHHPLAQATSVRVATAATAVVGVVTMDRAGLLNQPMMWPSLLEQRVAGAQIDREMGVVVEVGAGDGMVRVMGVKPTDGTSGWRRTLPRTSWTLCCLTLCRASMSDGGKGRAGLGARAGGKGRAGCWWPHSLWFMGLFPRVPLRR